MDDVLDRIDGFCDAVPRQWATAVDDGPLRLFTRTSPGWPFSARPMPGGGTVTRSDVERMRTRQRAGRVPEAFEWVLAAAPSMAGAVAAAGLQAVVCPLLVLDGDPEPAPLPPDCSARFLGPADGDLQAGVHTVNSVASAAFGAPPPGAPTNSEVAALRADLAAGAVARLLVTGPRGPVAVGSAQRCGDVIELVGIGTAEGRRGQGLGSAVTALLAAAARGAGADLVFLAAGSADATRVYERVGFRRVGECGVAEPA